MTQRMTLGAKLTAGFGAMMALVIALSGASGWVISSLAGEVNNLVQRVAETRKQSQIVYSSGARALSAERAIMLRSILQQPAGVEEAKQEFRDAMASMDGALNKILAVSDIEAMRRSASELRNRYNQLNEAHAEMIQALDRQQFEVGQKVSDDKVQPRAKEIVAEAEAMYQRASDLTMQSMESAKGKAASAYWIIGVLIAITFALGAVLWFMVGSSTKTLQELASDISGGANQVASAASQLATSSQSLAQAASEQAATLEETAASSQHLAGQTRSNLEHTQGASESVAVADKQISGANRTLESMVGSMQEITASSSKISRIIKVIDEIAFQTNILALNAAVEAARAGDAGMGFAVVADEVRNLAQRCAQAAKDTAQLIEESIEKSNGGQAKLAEVVQAIRGITDSSTTIRGLVEKVNDSSRDQSRSIEQISTSVTQMQRVTQSTAASAEESAAASEQMSSQAETMKDAVSRLHELVGGTEMANSKTKPRTSRSASASVSVAKGFDKSFSSKPSSSATADPFPMDQDFREF